MEEQIKALIEKYEGKVKEAERRQNDELDIMEDEQDEVFLQSMQMTILLCNKFISDLKQLLTTSQGNPDMV